MSMAPDVRTEPDPWHPRQRLPHNKLWCAQFCACFLKRRVCELAVIHAIRFMHNENCPNRCTQIPWKPALAWRGTTAARFQSTQLPKHWSMLRPAPNNTFPGPPKLCDSWGHVSKNTPSKQGTIHFPVVY
jgi:hypothetical protein